jgi:hypothetical protein
MTNEEKVIEYLKKNPHSTQEQIGIACGWSGRQNANFVIKKLLTSGKITFIKSTYIIN